jgi:hypothetical protein
MEGKNEAQVQAERNEAQRQRRKEAEDRRENEKRSSDGARYRLVTAHVIEGNPVPAGTEVGDGTPYPYEHTPSNQMIGVNPEGVRRVNEVHQRLYGKDAPWHDERFERERRESDDLEKKQRDEEANAAPVSYAQAYERGQQWEDKETKVPPHLHRPTQSLTRGGDTSQPLGPATADQDINNPDVQVRTTRPLEDQMPQGGGAASSGTQPKPKS